MKVEEGFSNKYINALDDKNRVFVPAAYRDNLGTKFMLTVGEDKYLNIYPMETWGVIQAELRNLPLSREEKMAVIRHYSNNAVQCSLDSQGRIVIPQDKKAYAELKKEVLFAGAQEKIEIWDPDNYNAKMSAYDIKAILKDKPMSFIL
jgi:MraZ protein